MLYQQQPQETSNQNTHNKPIKKGLIGIIGAGLLIPLMFLLKPSKKIEEETEKEKSTKLKRGDSWVDEESGETLIVNKKGGRKPKKKE